MTGRYLRLAGALIIVAVLAGCGGAKLNSMDGEFEDLYFAKLEQDKNDDKLNAAATAFGFATLAKRATKAGKKAEGKDWRTALAFYRIAALSAWQAGDRGSDQIFAVTDAGRGLCKDKVAEAPRDCMLMMLIAPFAVYDSLFQKLQQVKETTLTRQKLNAEELEVLKAVFDGVRTEFDKISGTRNVTETTAAPKALLTYIDRQRLFMYCTARDARSLMSLAREVGGPAEQTKRTDVFRELKATVESTHGKRFECPKPGESNLSLANPAIGGTRLAIFYLSPLQAS